MTSLPMIGLLATLAVAAQDPGEILGGWDRKPEKAVKVEDLDAEAADESRLLRAVAATEKLGVDHLLLAPPLEDLGVYYLTRKRSADAEPLLRRALAIREAAQGPDHFDVAKTLLNLAMCRMARKAKGDDTAGPMLRRALAIFEKQGKETPEVARTLHTLAAWHMARREYDPAESGLTRALAIQEKASGPDSKEVADILDALGVIHAARANWDPAELEAGRDGEPKGESKSERHGRLAEQFLKRALAIREKVLEPDDPDIARSLRNLGGLAFLRDRPADGEPYLERLLKLQKTARAPAGEERAAILAMLARASQERKDWAEAERRLAKAQTILETLKEPDRDRITEVLSERADVALEAGRFDDAETFLKRGLDIQADVHGPEDPDVVQARALTTGSYREHVRDRRAPVRWQQLRELRDRAWEANRHHAALGRIVNAYDDLLRRTNQVMPPPTEEDLAYLSELFHGMFPDRIEQYITQLIDLRDQDLDDEALAHMGRLYKIDRLKLTGRWAEGDRVITDTGLSHLKNLFNLRSLAVRGAEITDAGLAHLAGLEDLEELDLGINRLTDAGLVHLKGLKSLCKLRLSATNITDAGLMQLEAMKSLESLVINSTIVTEAGVERLRRARPGLEIRYSPGPGYRPLHFVSRALPDARPGAVPTGPGPGVAAPRPLPPGQP